ncbi:hypothetical protein JDV02_005063 [Purpureocillium takamizusanense]|uniref:DUF4048 domain-containing protein n=1 Tax=Purpureocillium takamizusanense TaxID=2060973 RepID=A0A9Q8QHM4_9HYPO|nr:uncharacterized protein JDV02_005063 [Purpureocillium takamizusanense]UNI18817.1 hypothetical protein JDV02_005063 [Purpureocillium takamizusanense]
MTGLLLRICAVDHCCSLVAHDYRHLTQAHHRALVARAARLRRRRATRAPSTPLTQKRTTTTSHLPVHHRAGSTIHSLQHSLHSFDKVLPHRARPSMVAQHEIRRRSSAADRTSPVRESAMTPEATGATSSIFSPPSDRARAHSRTQAQDIDFARAENATRRLQGSTDNDADMMPPPPIPGDAGAAGRLSRSNSAASRITNRLSLTLPIALPSSDPSRPILRSAAGPPAMPPTPVEQSIIASPSDANGFIIAIAAQERRVLELREELARAEADLLTLKKQWTATGSYHNRSVGHDHHPDTPQQGTPGAALDDENAASRRSVDLDRRKMLLQNQGQNTPTQNRRRVIRGGHTRTLSLLSPAKLPSGFSVLEDGGAEGPKVPLSARTAANSPSPALSKRASWQPRSGHDSPMMPWLVEDFKLGLRAFVEDIRQITVGDEPITGHASQTTPPTQNGSAASKRSSASLERKASIQSSRSRSSLGLGLDAPISGTSTPTPSSRQAPAAAVEKPKPMRNKRFSWTPLGFDAVDDSDWANWDSPGPSKSPRWSGSTMNSTGLEEIMSIPEAGEEKSTPVYVLWHEWDKKVPWLIYRRAGRTGR